jgi:hypothetical protein
MKERKRMPESQPAPEPPSDPRLRNLLPQLESFPEELRDALVTALEAVVRTHQLLEGYPKPPQH